MAGRGRLPFVAGNMIDKEDHLRDFLLGCPRPISVEGLQHPAQSRPPLPGQSRIRWNRTAMQSRKKAGNGYDAIKAVDAERNERGNRSIAANTALAQYPDKLPIAKVETEIRPLLGTIADVGARKFGLGVGSRSEQIR